MKKLLNRHFGYGPLPRRPLLPMGDDRAAEVFASAHLARLLALEEELRKAGDTQAST